MATKKMAKGGKSQDAASKAYMAENARINATKAASQKSAMAEQAKPYTDALDRAIKAKQAAPARPAGGTSGGMGGGMKAQKSAMADKMVSAAKAAARPMGSMGARAGMTRPAAPMGGMGMKKGGKAKAGKK
jgi:hypothetical protein